MAIRTGWDGGLGSVKGEKEDGVVYFRGRFDELLGRISSQARAL